jgi:phosphoserine phosphatase
MLELAGNPILVNPTRELIHLVTDCEEVRKKAKIVVERKDVIYGINFDELKLL